MERDQIIQDCLAYARESGYRAQINAQTSRGFGRSYKSLTGETLSEGSSESSLTLTLELAGRKCSRHYPITPTLDPKKMIDELVPLLVFATADPAESLPIVTGNLTEDTSKFSYAEIQSWVQSTYDTASHALSTNIAGLKIENLGVSASIGTRIFASTDGAYKVHSSSGSSLYMGYSGRVAEVGEVEWMSRSEPHLIPWQPSYEQELRERVVLKLAHKPATFKSSMYSTALEPELTAELLGELLGLLSGYAIAEKLTPFTLGDIGSKILPEWVDLSSLPTGSGLSAAKFFDGNGITTLPLTIAQKGVLTDIFLSKAAADRLGMTPNGHPGPINIVWQSSLTRDSLAGVPLLLTGLSGLHTMDSSTGNFTLE